MKTKSGQGLYVFTPIRCEKINKGNRELVSEHRVSKNNPDNVNRKIEKQRVFNIE